jgi:DNA-binding transcriptional MerR regulator
MTKPVRHPESGVYMTLEALARESGISVSAIRKALREHRIEGIKDSEGRWLIPIDAPLAHTWLTGETPDALMQRIAAIEKRLERLEASNES